MNFMCAKCLENPIDGAYRTSSESCLTTASQSIFASSSGRSCVVVTRTVREFETMSMS